MSFRAPQPQRGVQLGGEDILARFRRRRDRREGIRQQGIQQQKDERLGGLFDFLPKPVRDAGQAFFAPLEGRLGFLPDPIEPIAEAILSPASLIPPLGGARLIGLGGRLSTRLAPGLSRSVAGSVAGRVARIGLEPVVSGSLPKRLAAEAAFTAGAVVTGQEAAKQFGPLGGLAGGLIGGLGTITGGRVLARGLRAQGAPAIVREAEEIARRSAADIGNEFVAPPSLDLQVAGLRASKNPDDITQAAASLGIDPRLAARGEVGKTAFGALMNARAAEELGNTAMIGRFGEFQGRVGRGGDIFDLTDGKVTNVAKARNMSLAQVMSFVDAPNRFDLSPEQARFHRAVVSHQEEVVRLLKSEGIDRPTGFKDDNGTIYVPIRLKGRFRDDEFIEFARPSNRNLERVVDLAAERPNEAFEDFLSTIGLHTRAALQETAEAQLERRLQGLSLTENQVLSKMPETRKLMQDITENGREINRIAAEIKGAQRDTVRAQTGRAERQARSGLIKDLQDQIRVHPGAPTKREIRSLLRDLDTATGTDLRKVLRAERRLFQELGFSSRAHVEDFLNGKGAAPKGQRRALQDRLKKLQDGEDARGIRREARADSRRTTERLQDKLAKTKEKQRELRRQLSQKKKQLRLKRRLPSFIFGRNEGNIDVATFKNRFLPEDEDFATLTRFFDSMTGRAKREGRPLRTLQDVTGFIRFASATGDFAMPFQQGLPLLGRSPKLWAKMAFLHNKAFLKPEVQTNYLRQNLKAIQEMAQLGIPVGDIELLQEGLRSGLGQKLRGTRGLGNVIGRFQTAYDTGLLVARTELYKALKPTWTGSLEELAAHIRNMTGGLDSRAIGVGPTQRAAESLFVAFSPRLLRSTVGLLAAAARPNTPQGREAIRSLTGMAAAATALFTTVNFAIGIAKGESQAEILERIEKSLDPTEGKKFLAVEINGDWIGVGGQVRALTQFIARSIENPGKLVTVDDFENPMINFYRGRAAPGLNIALGGIEAATGEGVDVLPFDNIDNLGDLGMHLGKSTLPFVVQGIVDGEGVLPALTGFGGLRSSPQSPTEARNALSVERFGVPYRDLNPSQKQQLEDANPELFEEIRERGSKTQRDATARQEEINAEFEEGQRQILTAFQAGRFSSNAEFFDAFRQIEQRRAIQSEEARENFGIDFDSDSPVQKILDAFFSTFNESEIAPGVIDFEMQQLLEADVMRRIGIGEFGDPAFARDVIEGRSRNRTIEELRFLDDASDFVRDSGYYEIREEIFTQLQDRIQDTLGERFASMTELLRALNTARNAGDARRVALLTRIAGRVNRQVGRRRQFLRKSNPQLDQALFTIGAVTTAAA